MFKPVSSKTDFSALERKLLEKWYTSGIVQKYLDRNKNSSKKFSFLDGPITANNPMGVHHAWGRTYKDLWQRFYALRGYNQRFQNGFDEQGLWVEVEVEKELGLKSKKDIENLIPGDKFKSLEKFIQLCKERVAKFSRIQTEQSKRLGYFMDWDHSYHTSSDQNNYAIWNFLKVVHERGWLYKGRDSVPWCPRCGTAISQHEILTEEYKEITHRTVVFKLKLKGRDREYLLAWTTTPWTIPGNVALAVDSELTYWKMKDSEGNMYYLVSPENKGVEKSESLVYKFELLTELTKTGEVMGKGLVGLEYSAPYDAIPAVQKALNGYTHRVVSSDPVILPINASEGTGIVHVAPGAGGEDFKLGKKEKLPVIEEIDEEGIFLKDFDFVSNLSVKEASFAILSDLGKRRLVFKIADHTHRYPTCWRCKTELVWRVVDEWYISMDEPSKLKVNPSASLRVHPESSPRGARSQKSKVEKTYREMMIEVAKKINWIPKWGLERELDWLTNMHDWLISKKRYWGLALPIWECHKCSNFEVIGSQEELSKKAVEGWEEFERRSPHRPWIDLVKIKCSACGEIISRIPDVGNPWLDAGIVPFSTMPQDWFPADFITESFPGQFKNWFYSLIAMSTALKNEPPFKNILGFATMVDEHGEQFHKSKGNAIEFVEAADKAGADIIRWVCLRSNPENNVPFGYHIADESRRYFYLRLWNVYSFFVMYANADSRNPQSQSASWRTNPKSQNILDRWILSRLNTSIKTITGYVENYEAYRAVEAAEDFIINDFSTWYVRRIRDRVGPTAPNGKDKDDAYQTLWTVLTMYSRVLAPFIPFIADEIYTNLTGEESVHLADWPEYDNKLYDQELEKEMDLARKLAETIHARRKFEKVKVRIPIATCKYELPKRLGNEIEKVVEEETNVKHLVYQENDSKLEIPFINPDFSLTPELKAEGEARDIVRKIQEERKKLGVSLTDRVNVSLARVPRGFEHYISDKALVHKLVESDSFKVEKADA